MPAPSQKPQGQAMISAFFKPKPSSKPDPPKPASPTGPPPAKRQRVFENDKSRKETIEGMAQWRYSQPVAASEELPTPSQRSNGNEARHQAFKKKLLGADFVIDRRAREELNHSIEPDLRTEDSPIVIDDDEDEDNEPPAAPESKPANPFHRFASAARSTSNGNGKGKEKEFSTTYTPMEKQILELKAKYPGVLLIIEVGYKFKFFGEDARTASKELNIMSFPERSFYTAMVPVKRLLVHCRKLISLGYKVGIVRQIETRALKAASKNAYTPFVRKLTELYTPATWIDDLSMSEGGGDLEFTTRSKALMAIVEQSEGGSGKDDRVAFGVISVEVSTGNITYDQFSDTFTRSELETRISHLTPAEVLIPANLTKPTEKVITHMLGGGDGNIRIERLNFKPDYNQALEAVTAFYKSATSDPASAGTDDAAGSVLALVLDLPRLALVALAQIIQHLQAFNLESVCTLSTNFQSFSSRTTMLLNSNTLANLEIFRSTDTHQEKGSLFWMLNKCKTSMGKRMLRNWLAKPLTGIAALESRLDAVQAIVEGKSYVLRSLPSLLQGLQDLERGLARMIYGRITPKELATVLLNLNHVTQEFKPEDRKCWNFKAPLVEEHILNLSAGKEPVQRYLNQLSVKELRDDNYADIYVDPDRYPAIQEAKDDIAVVEIELRDHLRYLRKELKKPTLDYVKVADTEYLIEVRVADAKKVPVDWLRVNATKACVRFHTPEVLRLTKLRDQYIETREAAAKAAFSEFVAEICREEYLVLRNAVMSLAVLDVLVCFASLAASPGYSRPVFCTKPEHEIEIRGMRHPILEVANQTPYIPNDVCLSQKSSKSILLTGCNMGGKSSFARTLGLTAIMAQIGCYVPATYARLSCSDGIFVRMGATDAMFAGKSTFMVEVQETAEILKGVTGKSLVILDELGRGTSTYDGLCIAQGVLEYLLQLPSMPNTVFISHYFQLGDLETKYPGLIRNYHMAFTETPSADDGSKDIQFLYKLRRGIASKSFGVHCARLAGLPSEILTSAQLISGNVEQRHAVARAKKRNRDVLRLFHTPAGDYTETQLETLEQACRRT